MVNRVFIYGTFVQDEQNLLPFLSSLGSMTAPPPPTPLLPPEAIEILREPSITQLIGKLYHLTPARNYQPVTPFGIGNFTWFAEIRSALKENRKYFFEAAQGDKWLVRWLRQESDDAGSYMAIALEHS